MREARRLGVPIIALVDTNCDPDEADFIIPGNDDAIRSCSLIVRAIADGIAAGQSKVTPKEMAASHERQRQRRRRDRGRSRRPKRPAGEPRRGSRRRPSRRARRREPADEAPVAERRARAEPSRRPIEAPAAETTEEETA